MKTIPAALQTYIDQEATTLCLLCKVSCKNGTILGFTNLDASVSYNDGTGLLTYAADQGFTPHRIQATADLAIDNTELDGWVTATGVTEAQIRAGLFDFAKIIVYRVNYLDLSASHEIVVSGTAGETEFTQLGWKTEFRSLTQQLKQPISKLYSLTCRAKFGDAKCTKAFTWVSGSVTSVGVETDRQFTDSTATQADGFYALGVIEWLTGANIGQQMEIDSYVAKAFTHTFALAYAIAIGDTYRRRQDCDKTFAMCKNTHNNVLNNRSEHLIPVAEAAKLMVPGAYISTVGA
jgi:uncharacterized phage protein (TIGR02218 family)